MYRSGLCRSEEVVDVVGFLCMACSVLSTIWRGIRIHPLYHAAKAWCKLDVEGGVTRTARASPFTSSPNGMRCNLTLTVACTLMYHRGVRFSHKNMMGGC